MEGIEMMFVLSKVNKTVANSLIFSGCLDYLGIDRLKMDHELHILRNLKEREQNWAQNHLIFSPDRKNLHLIDLITDLIKSPIGKSGGISRKDRMPYVISLQKLLQEPTYNLNDNTKLLVKSEQELLGIAISTHSINEYEVKGANCSCQQILNGEHPEQMIFPVEVVKKNEYKINKGQSAGLTMAFLTVSVSTCSLDSVCIYPELYQKNTRAFDIGNNLMLCCYKDKKNRLVVKNYWDIEEVCEYQRYNTK